MHNADQTVRKRTEEADSTMQASANVIADQAEALQRAWLASSEMASNISARSVHQAARSFGITGDDTDKAAGRPSEEISSQAAGAVVHGVQAMTTELVDLVRHSAARSFDHMGAIVRCRSPQDFVTVQTDALSQCKPMLCATMWKP